MKPALRSFLIAVIALMLVSCAESERTGRTAKAPPTGSRFSAAGKVNLHPGQPCASQIMFDFHITGSLSTISLAAPARESRLLTEAVDQNRRVRIWGNWHHGQDRGCDYVNVNRVEPLSIAIVF
jgi:hypothetical protein